MQNRPSVSWRPLPKKQRLARKTPKRATPGGTVWLLVPVAAA
jgi:hypothetical protein